MELLELYARVEYEEAWKLILGLVEQRALHKMIMEESLSRPEGRVYPRFTIYNMEYLHSAGTFERFAHWFVLPIDPDDHSPMYQRACDLLQSRYADNSDNSRFQRSSSERIQLNFHFDLNWWGAGNATGPILEDMATLAVISQDPRRRQILSGVRASDAKPSEVFVLKAWTPRWDAGAVTDAMLRCLEAISTSSVYTEKLSLGSAQFGPEGISPKTTAKFLRTMLLSNGSPHPITSVALTTNLSTGVFQAALSALLHAPHVEFLNVRFPVEDASHELLWAWLAYLVFSREATNSIKRLDLDAERIAVAHVESFTQVLSARDPLAYISHLRRGQSDLFSLEQRERDPIVVDIRPKSTLLVRVDATSEYLTTMKTSKRVESLRLVDDEPGHQYVSVVCPGVGICWIDRDDVVARHILPTPTPSRPRKVQRLGFNINEGSPLAPLLQLLELVGGNIHTLSIRCIPGHRLVPSSFLRELLLTCPHLCRLELMQIDEVNFQWLPPTGLHSVMLDSVDPSDPDQYQGLLGDITSGRMDLRQLHIQNTKQLFDDIQDVMLHMLDTSHTLEHFFISFDTEDFDGTIAIPAQAQELEKRNGASLNVQKARFPLQSKLAFISSTQAEMNSTRTAKRQRHNLPELDIALMAHIFSYAAPHKTRVCGAVPFKESC